MFLGFICKAQNIVWNTDSIFTVKQFHHQSDSLYKMGIWNGVESMTIIFKGISLDGDNIRIYGQINDYYEKTKRLRQKFYLQTGSEEGDKIILLKLIGETDEKGFFDIKINSYEKRPIYFVSRTGEYAPVEINFSYIKSYMLNNCSSNCCVYFFDS